MPADLRVVLAILNRDEQQQTGLLHVFCADAPAARHAERVIKDLPAVGGIDSYDRELDLMLTVEIGKRRLHSALCRIIDDLRIVIYITRGRRQWRLILLRCSRAHRPERDSHRHTK